MSTSVDSPEQCAACGKGGDSLKKCNACKLVKYCDVTCQAAHRPLHKKECRKRVAELRDEALFKPLPQQDDCPVCFLPLPTAVQEQQYQYCCGQSLCIGCMYGAINALGSEDCPCPFCRTMSTNSRLVYLQRIKVRMDANDASAFNSLACKYSEGKMDFLQDHEKAIFLWTKAGKLGSTTALRNIASAYHDGRGVDQDLKKAKYHHEQAAMGGDVRSHWCLGIIESNTGKIKRAMKHWMIAAKAGDTNSLREIKTGFMIGCVTKADFEHSLRAHQEYVEEIQSDQRKEAFAAFNQLSVEDVRQYYSI